MSYEGLPAGESESQASGNAPGRRQQLAAGFKGAWGGLTGGAASAAAGARDRIANVNLQEMGGNAKGWTNQNVQALKEAGFGLHEKGAKAMEKRKQDAEKKLFELSEPLRWKVMFALRDIVKGGVVGDPDMCDCVKDRVAGLIDLMWEDLIKSVNTAMDEAKGSVGDKSLVRGYEHLAAFGETSCCLSPKWFRAQFLYHLVPFDLSIFGNLKDPVFLIQMVFMCLPSFSFAPAPFNMIPVRVPFFILYIILIMCGNPPDEYQLVLYIMSIKGLMAVSSGICAMCIAATQYYMCVHPGSVHTCEKSGPGVTIPIIISMVDWIGISSLVWMAFLALPYSVRTAGVREIIVDEEEGNEEANSNSRRPEEERSSRCCMQRDSDKGGRLAGWLRYDFTCCMLCFALLYGIYCIDSWDLREISAEDSLGDLKGKIKFGNPLQFLGTPQGRSAIFWCRVVYSLLSLPFVLFWVPGLQGILTHTTLTGYNRQGYVVPYQLRPMPEKEE